MMSLPGTPLENDHVRLELIAEDHREQLRAAANADAAIWEIYPVCMADPHFDAYWQQAMDLQQFGARQTYTVMQDGVTVGTSSFYTWPDLPEDSVSIGGTYYAPHVRGTKLNPSAKLLMMDHAFRHGATAVFYHVDVRNARSQAAVLKLGAARTRIVEKHMTTWTGHLRDTAEFVVSAADWPRVKAGLEARVGVNTSIGVD